MKRKLWRACLVLALCACVCLCACSGAQKPVRIGVSFGVGKAVRWDAEKIYMEEHAAAMGAEIEVRINRTDEPKTQQDDCFEMLDSGIDVLILTPRDATKACEIVAYAKEKNVPIISYSRVVLGQEVDLFVGYDSSRMGQRLGQYLAELVTEGDYILLRGDDNDSNAKLLHEGAMQYLDPIRGNVNVLLEAAVPGWSPEEAERMVTEAVEANGNRVDAILAPNDAIAGACAEALQKLGVQEHVIITGTDAELTAAQRILAGTQDCTMYMDLKELANTAVEEAIHLARKEKVNVNTTFDNQTPNGVNANLIAGQLVTKQNLDKVLIDTGYFTKEQVYGK